MPARNIIKSIQDIMRKDAGVDGDAQRLSQLCWMLFLKIICSQEEQIKRLSPRKTVIIPERLQWKTWATNGALTGEELLTFINNELFPKLKNLSALGSSKKRAEVIVDVFEDARNYMKDGTLIRQAINKIDEINFESLVERKNLGDIYEQMLNDLQAAGNSGEFYTPRGLTAFIVKAISPEPGEVILDPSCGTGGFLTDSIRFMRNNALDIERSEPKIQKSLRAIELKQLPHMLCVTNMLLHEIEDASFVKHENSLSNPIENIKPSDQVDIILTNPPFGATVQDGLEKNFPEQLRSKETTDLFIILIISLLKNKGRAAVVVPDGFLFGEGSTRARIRKLLMQQCDLHTIVRLPNSIFKPYASIGTNILFFEKGKKTNAVWFYEHKVPVNQKSYSMTKPIRAEHLDQCLEWWGGIDRKNRTENDHAWCISIEQIEKKQYSLDFKNPYNAEYSYDSPENLIAELAKADERIKIQRELLQKLLREAFAE